MTKEKLVVCYEIAMMLLAVMVVGFVIAEFTFEFTPETLTVIRRIDMMVLVIFALDYGYRFYTADQRKRFARSNIPDLIAIIPFSSVFRLARLARLLRLIRLSRMSRLTRLVRAAAFLRVLYKKVEGILKTNGLIYMLCVTGVLVVTGGVAIMYFEDTMSNFGDAIWWSLVTTTTVGYGDISPQSLGGRVIAGILMILGIGLLGMVTGSIATYFLSPQASARTSYKLEIINGIKSRLDDIETLTIEDVRDINRVLKSLIEENDDRQND